MLLTTASTIALRLLNDHGLTAKGWALRWTSSMRVLGYCSYGPKTITLSRQWVAKLTESELVDLMLHEIAHAVAGHCAGHGPEWQKVAAQFGVKTEECGRFDGFLVKRFVAKCGCNRNFYKTRLPHTSRVCTACRETLRWVDLRGIEPVKIAARTTVQGAHIPAYAQMMRDLFVEGELVRTK